MSAGKRAEGAKSGAKKAKDQKEKENFVWTDDEVSLLLQVTREYKVSNTLKSVDWESVHSKYSDIANLLIEQIPPIEEAKTMGKDYPHIKEEFTKDVVSRKLKNVRTQFRKAIDSGKRSGHGRVVLIYFEECEAIWGGSPATKQIEQGLETSDIDNVHEISHNSHLLDSLSEDADPVESSVDEDDDDDDDTRTSISSVSASSDSSRAQVVKERRGLLNEKLKNHKQEKLKRKLSVDNQLLTYAQDDLELKKKMMEHMQKMDGEYMENMNKVTSNLDNLTKSINEGFSLLRSMLTMAPPTNPYMQPPQPQFPQSYHSLQPMSSSNVPSTSNHPDPYNQGNTNYSYY